MMGIRGNPTMNQRVMRVQMFHFFKNISRLFLTFSAPRKAEFFFNFLCFLYFTDECRL